MVFTILIHNCQTFGAFGFGAGFRNINNAGVKIAFFTGQTFINSVGNNVATRRQLFLVVVKDCPLSWFWA